MNNGNNGHNGNGQRKNVKYVTLKVREDLLERLRASSINAGMSYSDYIDQLMKINTFNKIFEDPQLRDALNNMTRHIAKKAQELQIQESGGFSYGKP